MDEIVKGVFTAPLATVFVVAGMIFLLVAVVGNISGKIEPSAKGRVISGILGLAFIITGLAMHLTQKVPQMPGPPITSQEQIKRDQLPEKPRTQQLEKQNYLAKHLFRWQALRIRNLTTLLLLQI
jgi:hypothetical protein